MGIHTKGGIARISPIPMYYIVGGNDFDKICFFIVVGPWDGRDFTIRVARTGNFLIKSKASRRNASKYYYVRR